MLDRNMPALDDIATGRCIDLLPLRVSGLSLTRNNEVLLRDINFEIDNAGITLIMGPNGAGKSILMRLLHGLDKPDSGLIEWGDKLSNQQPSQRQAMVFQKPVLLRRSAASNIDFAIRLNGPTNPKLCNDVLNIVGLSGMAKRPARSLSGGEQQRLALARALAVKPDILFLDEPTANLDPASTKIIEDIVLAQKQAGTKIIFVTHHIGQAQRIGDDVLFLNRGRLTEQSPAKAFFKKPNSQAARDYLAGNIVL